MSTPTPSTDSATRFLPTRPRLPSVVDAVLVWFEEMVISQTRLAAQISHGQVGVVGGVQTDHPTTS
ncbi:MAG: hypothetical protein HY328_19700 [Chloroflexi bacterium]|nr:hypothetical protein [Chloroflexota bacterium]